jgi:hypothetical protein
LEGLLLKIAISRKPASLKIANFSPSYDLIGYFSELAIAE